jgi:hypothetical protein
MISLDLAHSVVIASLAPGAYFATVVPSYVVMPIITTPTMGYLERSSLKPRS